MQTKDLLIYKLNGQLVGVDPITGDVYSPETGMNGIFSWVGTIFKGGGDAVSSGVSSATQTAIGKAAIGEVTKDPTLWSKIGNVAGQVGQAAFNPDTAVGGLTQAAINNWAANIANRGVYGAGYPAGGVPPSSGGIDQKTLIYIGGGVAALLILVLALK